MSPLWIAQRIIKFSLDRSIAPKSDPTNGPPWCGQMKMEFSTEKWVAGTKRWPNEWACLGSTMGDWIWPQTRVCYTKRWPDEWPPLAPWSPFPLICKVRRDGAPDFRRIYVPIFGIMTILIRSGAPGFSSGAHFLQGWLAQGHISQKKRKWSKSGALRFSRAWVAYISKGRHWVTRLNLA